MDYKKACRDITENNDEYLFLSGVCDKISASENKNIMTATKFLDARQISLVKQLIASIKYKNYIFDGGISDAERMVCVFLPDAVDYEQYLYPVAYDLFKFIRAEKSPQDNLSHRDYLGSLMGLSINRNCIGDIFVHENGADIVVLSEIADFLMLEYKKAGKKTLSLRYIQSDEIISGADDFSEMKIIVPSMRFDVIAGDIFKLSRSKSIELIKQGRILLNSSECVKPDKLVAIGDKITVRGKGKAEILSVEGKTKKDRTVLLVKVYG